jgi:hypothetical protein
MFGGSSEGRVGVARVEAEVMVVRGFSENDLFLISIQGSVIDYFIHLF